MPRTYALSNAKDNPFLPKIVLGYFQTTPYFDEQYYFIRLLNILPNLLQSLSKWKESLEFMLLAGKSTKIL